MIKQTNIFDLEQKLLNFSNIIADLRDMQDADKINSDNIDKLIQYYDMKFDMLWLEFDNLCKEYYAHK